MKKNNTTDEIIKNLRTGKFNKIKNLTAQQLKEIYNNKSVSKNNKYKLINKAFAYLGGRDVYNAVGNNIKLAKIVPPLAPRNKNIKSYTNVLSKYDSFIDFVLLEMTQGELVLGKKLQFLGRGVAGVVLKCISRNSCNPKYKNAVLKVSKNDKEYENEVKTYNKLNSLTLSRPIAPKMFGHFIIDNHGFIVIQNAQTMYQSTPHKIVQLVDLNVDERMKVLPALEVAVSRLHKEGIGHGNMHSQNIWVAIRPGKGVGNKYKVFFTDFGRSYNTNRNNTNKYKYIYTKNKNKGCLNTTAKGVYIDCHIYPGMAYPTPLRTLGFQSFMDDDEVLEMYEEYDPAQKSANSILYNQFYR